MRRVRQEIGRTAAWAALGSLLVLACAGEPDERVTVPAETVPADTAPLVTADAEEIRVELENLVYEIDDLEAYLAAMPPDRAPAADADPRALLDHARTAHEAAAGLSMSGDLAAAAESLSAGMVHVEQVKRALGLAEEWGEEVPP
jgi:hypothetical protein